jgi:DNA-binding IclR family transcriptional regulator
MEPAAIVAEGRVLDAVATEAMRGTIEEIASTLGLSVGQLRAAVAELASIGWVEVTQLSDGAVFLDLPGDAR